MTTILIWRIRSFQYTFRTHHPKINYPYQPPLRQSSTASVTRINHNPLINPPSSTLPPPLVLPSRSPSQSTISYYFALGRAYLGFYKIGAKAVYTNFQESRVLINRLPPSLSIPDALKQGQLSRGEWQFIRRSRQDFAKVPLFALVFIVCGEFTPLVVFFLGGVVPRPCRIPKQIGSMREKAEERRQRSFRSGTLQSNRISPTIEALRHEELQHIGRSLGLYSKWWDRMFNGAPTALVRSRAQKRVEYLGLDDMAITRDGGVGRMEIEEVRIALEERGVDVLGKNDTVLNTQLRTWLNAGKFQPVTRLLVTRPSVWQEGNHRTN
ncbi:hypothetical protein MMC14_001785 [Varicellaria rhodocarpa]|nr:hypothetical protein [Varicellaria rhodocarpa]